MKKIITFLGVATSLLQALPVALPAALAGFGAVVVLLLITGKLYSGLVAVLGFCVFIGSYLLVWHHTQSVGRKGSVKEQKFFDVLVVVGVVLWVVIGARYTAQNVYVYRDPGIYTVAAEKIRKDTDLNMEATRVFGGSPVISTASAAFGTSKLDDTQLSTQGLHLFPALLGLIGRLVGQSLMLHAAPLFGGTALLAIYGLARLITKPRWAAFAVGAISITLPFVYFSRDTYTELLAATFTFGALSLLWLAQKSEKSLLWVFAGLVLGAGTFTRVDAYFTIAGMTFAVAYYLARTPEQKRKKRIKHVGAFMLATALMSLLGWLDLTRLSSLYYHDLRGGVIQQLGVAGFAGVLGVLLVVLSWRTRVISTLLQKYRKQLGASILVAMFIIFAVLASRPLWLVSHAKGDVALIAAVQEASGLDVEPNRNYAEHSITWLMWYIGLPLLFAGAVGMGLLFWRGIKSREIVTILPILLVVGGTALVYLIRPSIAADQVWASRRFVPVIIPGVIIFGAYALERLSATRLVQQKLVQQSWGLCLTVALLAPAFYTYPFARQRMYVPQLSQINEVCSSLPDNAAVVWVGVMGKVAPRTSNVFCGFPSVGYRPAMGTVDGSELGKAAREARSRGYIPILATEATGLDLLPAGSATTALTPIQFNVVPSTITSPPRYVVNEVRTIHVGIIQNDGSIQENQPSPGI